MVPLGAVVRTGGGGGRAVLPVRTGPGAVVVAVSVVGGAVAGSGGGGAVVLGGGVPTVRCGRIRRGSIATIGGGRSGPGKGPLGDGEGFPRCWWGSSKESRKCVSCPEKRSVVGVVPLPGLSLGNGLVGHSPGPDRRPEACR